MASVMMTRRVDHLLLIFCLAFCFGSISAAPCYNYSWIEVPSASVLNTTLNVTVSNASDCQMRCYNNLTCTGYALDKTIPNNTRCYFNFALTNSSNSGITYFRPDTNISYFSLLRDTPSCGLLDSNCSYMWKGQKDLHGFDGVEGNRSTLNGCVRLCQNTPNCTGVDWNQQDTNCWINFNYPVITGNQPNITFFQRNCNDTVPATTKATTPGPTTTTTTTTTTTIPTTTIITTTSTTTTTTIPTTPTTTPTTAPTTIGLNCGLVPCSPGKSCQLNSIGQPECLCNTACTQQYDPICGSDGKTYGNRCELGVAACQTSNNITVAYAGECQPGSSCDGISCPPGKSCQLNSTNQPECLCNTVCTKQYDPVCGSDGKTYANRCEFMVAACQTSNNVTVSHDGQCLNCDVVPCSPGKSCQLNWNGQPECLCNTACTQQYDPICGSDGKTYGNRCELGVAACQTSNNITVAYAGECQPDFSCDGISCPPGKSCQLNSTNQPECILCNTACTKQYVPVCGSDGKTYANRCEFMVAACQTSNNITVAHDGQCPTAPEAIRGGDFENYPMAIKPAYIVLAGLGGGCIVLVITAVVILCVYPLHKNLKYSTNSTVTTVHTHQPHTADNNSYEADEQERIDMDDMAEGEVKTYYNAEEVN